MTSPQVRKVQIDASSHCQLACPVCPTANGLTKPVLGAGHLKVADFERLLDRNPEIQEVELSNYGEMFLNPQLPELLACAYERKVVVSGSNGVNLNFATEAALEAVVKYRVRALTCCIDGATQANYARYRVNGNLDRVLRHIDRIRELRHLHRSAFPLLDWQFVVMGHNEQETEMAKGLAQSRGMQFLPRLSWNADHSPVVNTELVRIETGLPAASREEFRQSEGVSYTRSLCYQLWQAPVVNWNGKMLGCCVNYWGDFGANVFEEGLTAAMQHPLMEQARGMLLGETAAVPGIPCTTCDQYREMSASGTWLDPAEIAASQSGDILTGLVLKNSLQAKFARVAVHEGVAEQAVFGSLGRVFRFGTDTAVYFRAGGPGLYTIFVQGLGAGGWLPVVRHLVEVRERPVCQEFEVDTSGSSIEATPAGTRPAVPVSSWIR